MQISSRITDWQQCGLLLRFLAKWRKYQRHWPLKWILTASEWSCGNCGTRHFRLTMISRTLNRLSLTEDLGLRQYKPKRMLTQMRISKREKLKMISLTRAWLTRLLSVEIRLEILIKINPRELFVTSLSLAWFGNVGRRILMIDQISIKFVIYLVMRLKILRIRTWKFNLFEKSIHL